MGWNDFRLAAVGTTYDNEDGSSRQEELRRLAAGDRLLLVREPGNPHDSRAVAVRSAGAAGATTIGYLSRDHATWVGSKIDRGYDVRAIVCRIKGEGRPDGPLGLVMVINMDGEDPQLDGEAALLWRAAA